ncbi:MAG: hypothetical protein OSW77_05875 [Proteobacteria bacterium]|nr:hypothetical protein [Pseudomonadota bacterium]
MLRIVMIWVLLFAAAAAPAGAQDAFRIDAGRLSLGGFRLDGLHLACHALQRTAAALDCRDGVLGVGGQRWPARFVLRDGGRRIELTLPASAGGATERWRLAQGRDGAWTLDLEAVRLARLAALLPLPAAIVGLGVDGRLDGRLRLGGGRVSGELRLAGGRFASTDGTRAGEGLALTLSLALRQRGGAWQGQLALAWTGGELYLAPFYLERLQLALPGGGSLRAQGVWPAGATLPDTLTLQGELPDLAAVGTTFLAPLLAARALPPVTLAGGAALDLAGRQGGQRTLEVALREVAVDLAGRHALRGVDGRLAWAADGVRESRLRVGGGTLAGLPLGRFELPLRVRPDGVELAGASVPVLDGELLLDDWAATRPASPEGGWQWRGGLALTPLSLPALTQALGLPALGGTLSFSLPRLRHDAGALTLDGTAVIQAFDGYLSITGLRLIDPFGPLPRLSGEIEARHLDLGLLTETYDFGRITGFVDADIHGLEMAGLQPLAFDARVASSPGRYPRRISQRAVQNIGALGGGGSAALQRTFLRFFEDFGYERIGLSCRLAGGVCTMGGIEAAAPAGSGAPFLIVQGGGIPALSIVGYNRRVDWPELVERLRGAIRNNLKPEIR